MLNWFRGLDQRDQRAVLAALVTAAGAVVWLALIDPMHDATQRSETRFIGSLDSHRNVHDISNDIRQAGGQRLGNDEWSPAGIESIIEEIADPSVRAIVHAPNQQQMLVQIDALDYEQLIDLLMTLEQFGAFVDEAEIEPSDSSAKLQIKLTLGR